MTEHVDVLIVGAGLSGIGAACHLREKCPGKTFVLLESREASGGTWDLFRYPGIRSDSDMYTLGYSFKPWEERKAIADGPSILSYVRKTAEEHGVDSRIRYGLAVRRASWSSEDARWTVEAERGPKKEVVRFTCNFLWGCAGYYDYNEAHTPEFVGQNRFAGRIVHPQFWSDDIDYAGKRVVVIGSGATAVTLVPAMANDASHVVMLQRSPTYIVSLPSEDAIAGFLRRRLPSPVAYSITRWKNVMLGLLIFQLSRRRPAWMKKRIMDAVRKQLGEAYDVDTHFNPSYSPWDQRLCLVPDADLFESIKSGKTSVVTGEIETFTERGIRLKSGEELDADLIVTATGLKLRFFGGIELTVDGRRREAAELMAYKGMMFSEVPNLACTFGYTNASWTLKADLTAEYVCRLLQHMDAIRARKVVPRRDPAMGEVPFLDFSSGYVQRALSYFPKQGEKRPWRLYQNYALDILTMRFDSIDDGTLEFSGATDFSGTTGSPRREKRSAGNGRARVSNAAD